MSTMIALGIDRLSVEERLTLVQEIWDSIGAEVEAAQLSEAQRREIDRRMAAHPATPAYSPVDVAATMMSALGIDPAGFYRDALDRPYAISEGKVMRGVYE